MTAAQHLAPGEFYGRIVRRSVCSGATLSVVRHARERELPLHQHEQPYFCLLVEGQYNETYAGETIAYDPFSIALHPASYSHSDTIASIGATFFTIELGTEWHERLRDLVDLHSVEVRLSPDDVSRAGVRTLREMLQAEEPNELVVESLLYEMLSAFAQPVHDTHGGWLDAAKSYIDENLTVECSMAQIASAAGVHPVSLARAFKVREGQTVGEYVNRTRVARACQALRNPAVRIAQIAADLGYVDQSHLTRVFKNVTGMTPGVFRDVVLQSGAVADPTSLD